MANAVRFYETGGPEVLRYEEVEVGDRAKGIQVHRGYGMSETCPALPSRCT